MESRSGLSVTAPMGAQFRVSPDQRAGVAACGKVAKGDGIVGGAFDAAAGKSGGGVAVNKQAEQDFRVVGGAAATGVGAGERAEVDLFDGFDNETRKMILGEPVVDRGR